MTKTLFFDMGNVLLFFSKERMVKQIAELCKMSQEAIYKLIVSNQLWERYESGAMSSEELYKEFCSLVGEEIPFEKLMLATSDIFSPNEDLLSLLDKLQHHQLILLSNTSPIHYNFVQEHYDFLDQFEHKVLSFEVGAAKPDSKIFEHALSLAKCPKEETLYIDDIANFTTAAKKLGMPSYTYKSTDRLIQELEERNFL